MYVYVLKEHLLFLLLQIIAVRTIILVYVSLQETVKFTRAKITYDGPLVSYITYDGPSSPS
jgi:hypothetical protein